MGLDSLGLKCFGITHAVIQNVKYLYFYVLLDNKVFVAGLDLGLVIWPRG